MPWSLLQLEGSALLAPVISNIMWDFLQLAVKNYEWNQQMIWYPLTGGFTGTRFTSVSSILNVMLSQKRSSTCHGYLWLFPAETLVRMISFFKLPFQMTLDLSSSVRRTGHRPNKDFEDDRQKRMTEIEISTICLLRSKTKGFPTEPSTWCLSFPLCESVQHLWLVCC